MVIWQCWISLVAAVANACWMQQWRHSSAAAAATSSEVVDPDPEMGTAGEMPAGEEERSTPPLATAAGASGQHQQIHSRWGETVMATVRRIHGHMLGGISTAISVVKVHIWVVEVGTKQSEDHGNLKRLYEDTKKAILFETLLLGALCNHPYYYSSNTAFKISLTLVLLGFFTNILCAQLFHLNLSTFLIKGLIYTSTITQMLMPLFLLVSSGQLQLYMILIVPSPFFSVALFHRDRSPTDASSLDHSFDISAWIYALSAGTALISPHFASNESVAASPLACSLFLSIFIARYLMLISTLRPPVVIDQVETLMNILKLLWGLTLILFILDGFGWRVALVATSVAIIDAVLFSMSLLPRSPSTTKTEESSDQRKEQQLLSAVMLSILFTALFQAYSDHVAAHEVPLQSAAMLHMLLHFGAFLWALNRMLITPSDLIALPVGGQAAVWVWYILEWMTASVVVVATMDVVYKFAIAFIAG